jgi:hypothetical protein
MGESVTTIPTMSRILLVQGYLVILMIRMLWKGHLDFSGAQAATTSSLAFSIPGPDAATNLLVGETTRSARWNGVAVTTKKEGKTAAASFAPRIATTAIRSSPESATKESSSVEKDRVLELLRRIPPNVPTPPDQTIEILRAIRDLEPTCPTPDDLVVSDKLAGTWELLWTAQDSLSNRSEDLLSSVRNWINPIENQAYSNNPLGRSDPVLPRQIQDRLEQAGVLMTEGGDDEEASSGPTIRSTQTIDVRNRRVQNVVSLRVALPPPLLPFVFFTSSSAKSSSRSEGVRASLAVDVDFRPDGKDPRTVNVKFRSCAVRVPKWFPSKELKFPLGVAGPTGWLRTVYLDDDLRVTRGHKGSVFVLRRPRSRK